MNIEKARVALKQYFGYDEFRPMQDEIVQCIYQKKDALVLMPTGGGKSMCFQIPAITLPGVCIVVSPLISLMKDQVEGLKSNGIEAAFLNSSQVISQQREIEQKLSDGIIKLLYVSPEKMLTKDFSSFIGTLDISLFAIDEAHCISSWGHDFRKEYTQLGYLKRQFPNTPIMALTATADKMTRQDILDQMKLTDPKVFIASFDRPNLSLSVLPGQKRIERILDFLGSRPKESGIIYCLSRKNTEAVAKKLTSSGYKAIAYHAGLEPKNRALTQERFINDEVPIVCATVAFGMGIDKSNVRWVIHYNLPKNLESYYQEIGRAGRDGAPGDTVLFYSYQDVRVIESFVENNDQQELQMAKIERMKQYAEAHICRRKVLLSYFGEILKEPCGNCDVCKNPPQQFDGTIISQKALSAIARVRGQATMGILIDVLRGSRRREILESGFDKIKTFGLGGEHSRYDWQVFLQQLLHQGFIEIAYGDHHKLKLTSLGNEVLFEGRKVELVKMNVIEDRKKAEKAAPAKKLTSKEKLFEILREIRKGIAKERGVPAYLIFTDATLLEMVDKTPTTDNELKNISGIGERKLFLYGDKVIEAIRQFIRDENPKMKGSTYKITGEMLKQGKSVEEIAKERKINPVTVYSHVAYLYEKNQLDDISAFITQEEIDTILPEVEKAEEPIKMKTIFEYFKEEIPYFKIRLTIAHQKRKVMKR